MTPAQEHLQNHLRRLKLHRMEQVLATAAEEATKTQLGYTDFLTQLLEAELDARYERTTRSPIRLAPFPWSKTLADFNFSFPPSLDQQPLKERAKLRFIDQGENGLFLGPPGVGKTHLAVALGMKAAEAGSRVLFTTASDLVTTLAKALAEHRFEERLQGLWQPKLLVIDEIGYLPLDTRDATWLFQWGSRRYERGSIILTSHQSYGAWGAIFAGDSVIASAILDRLLHHATTINIKGESYQLKDKRRAGLIQPAPLLPAGGEAMA